MLSVLRAQWICVRLLRLGCAVECRSTERQHDLKLKCGEDAILGCHGPKNATIRIIRWSRDNIQPDTYVFYYKQNRDHEELQDPSFKDVSVILRNVTMNDTGTYKCYVGNTNINKTVSINLTVEEPGDGLIVGLSVSAMLLVVFVAGFVLYRNRRGRPLPNNPMI
uniref:Ig-like domain-containing protein n=1 Tax=Neolamprologus brichardi TaxID=32507 RepID=A0A3Q4HTD7_NEOBR